jgi:hypothetical protein
MKPTPAAEAQNHRNALEAARAHFGTRKPTYAEAHHYGDRLGFEAQQFAKANGNWSGQHEAAADARYYAGAAALELHFAK